MAMATSALVDSFAQDYSNDPLPPLFDSHGCLVTALSIHPKGLTPHRLIVDLAFHEIGLNPHPHVFYYDIKTTLDSLPTDSLCACCQICYKQYTFHVQPAKIPCKGQTHHLHAKFDSDSVKSECCHCGLQAHAILETSALAPSLLYRIRSSRKPKAALTNMPHFLETIETLIRILQGAADGKTDGINAESKVFATKIYLDSDIKQLFDLLGFSFLEGRFFPPEPSVSATRLLNRAIVQLHLVLSQEKPGYLAGVGTVLPVYQRLFEMMGVDEYLPNGMAKQIDLSNKMALNTERESSFGKLGCLSNMNDDLILDTFQTQVGHDLTKAHVLVDALLEVKKTRNSEKLDFELVRLRSESIVSTMELRAAYRDFEIGESGEGISTEVLIGLLRASIHVGSKPNLEIIIKSRNDLEMSQITEDSFWAEDIPPELEDPILDLYYAQHPVGLANIGNTCYLNSLLQYMYTIRDIRETVMNMDAYLENESDPDWKEKVIDGRTLSRQDVAEAKEIVSELNKLFTSMLTAKSRSVTPSTRLVELLLSTGKDGLTDVTGTRAQDQFFEQQDVSETMSILMYRLNAAFQPVPSEQSGTPLDRFYKLFYAKASKKSSDDKKEMEGQSNNRVIEDFNTLLLNVKEDIAMEELVDNYFDAGNQQQSPDLGGGSASGSTDSNANTNDNVITMTELPPILQIHLMRTQFDRIDKTSYKSNAKVSIPKRLYLDQYLDSFQSGDEVRFKRLRLLKQERRQHRKDLERLLNRRKHSVLSLKRTLPFESEERSSASVLKSPSVPIAGEEELAAMATDSQPRSQSAMDIELTGPARSVTRTDVPHYNDHGVENSDSDTTEQLERKILELNAKIQEEVQGLVTAEYKIHAVFHHEGGANFGHYWVYILDDPAVSAENPEQSQQSQPRWLKYSDDLVSEVGSSQEDEVFNGVEGSTACFCVYVRNNSSDIVQTIVRSIS